MSYEIIRQVRRHLTTIELEWMDENPELIQRCTCEAIKLLGQLGGISSRDVCNSLPVQASYGEPGISGAPNPGA